ncbi:MAG: septum formation initiator family protein [Coriobacteriales bacterium]|jgi:cell division protein FtsB|nr:septum formation initiator family protein [Coriobacteriales bacterium]
MAKINVTKDTTTRIHPALVVAAVIVLGVILAVIILYPAAREHHIIKRENEHAHAENQAVKDRNAKIEQQIDELSTLEGIEDRAREEFGWVRPDEEAVNITGLSELEGSTRLPSAIEPGSVKAPRDWWMQTLDEFFGVVEDTPAPVLPEGPVSKP